METVFCAHALAARIEREIATRESTSSCAASPRRQERTTETIIFRRRRAFARVSAPSRAEPSRADRRLGPPLWLRGGRRPRCRCAGGVCRSETPFRPGRGGASSIRPFSRRASGGAVRGHCCAQAFGLHTACAPNLSRLPHGLNTHGSEEARGLRNRAPLGRNAIDGCQAVAPSTAAGRIRREA